MKLAHLFAKADPPGKMDDFAGTYFAGLPERAEILQLHEDGTAGMTLSDQVTAGARGFTFSDSLGSWKIAGPRKVSARPGSTPVVEFDCAYLNGYHYVRIPLP